MEDQFTAIAPIYDALMAGVPYGRWTDYVRRMAHRYRHRIRRLLDIGCGTGNATLRLAAPDVEAVGIDASPEMIAIARRKAENLPNARFFTARMEEIDLGETFDTAISLFDSVNYVTDPEDLREAHRRIFRHLEPGGLWMFDMNTPYALEMELFTQNNLGTPDEPQYHWKSHYDRATRLTTVDMSFFVKQGNTRVTLKEVHHQRAYSLEEMDAMLRKSGFDVLSCTEAYTDRRLVSTTDRAFFVARRPFV